MTGARAGRKAAPDPECERLVGLFCNACLCNGEVPGYVAGCRSISSGDVLDVGREATCPWPCDDDCPELCHEVHLVAAKRTHEREDCPAVTVRALYGDAEPIRRHYVEGQPCDGSAKCGVDHG